MKPAVVRMANVTSESFTVRLQNPSNEEVDPCNVHCVAVEEGVWILPNGSPIEAQSYVSSETNGARNGWNGEQQRYLHPTYRHPVVLGQVMSYNDSRWSTFFSTGRKRQHAARRILKTGKHVGQDPDTERVEETIGFIVVDPVHSQQAGAIEFEATSGPRRVHGYTHPRQWPYRFRQKFRKTTQVIVLSQASIMGVDGSWPVLAGKRTNARRFGVAVDEDQLADAERMHRTDEAVDFMAFAETGTIELHNPQGM